jgi:hypothetical protein
MVRLITQHLIQLHAVESRIPAPGLLAIRDLSHGFARLAFVNPHAPGSFKKQTSQVDATS